MAVAYALGRNISIRPRNRRENSREIGVDDVIVRRRHGFKLELSIIMLYENHINVSALISTRED